MHPQLKRLTSHILIAALLGVTLPLQTARAGMVGTQQLLAAPAQAERARLAGLLEREDVRRALLVRGVDPDEARARVAALTEDEVTELNGRLDQLPAGGDALGVLFAVFLILLVTDIMGFTKVFPFTKSMR